MGAHERQTREHDCNDGLSSSNSWIMVWMSSCGRNIEDICRSVWCVQSEQEMDALREDFRGDQVKLEKEQGKSNPSF